MGCTPAGAIKVRSSCFGPGAAWLSGPDVAPLLMLLAKSSGCVRGGHERGEVGASGLFAWFACGPSADAVKTDGGSREHMLKMGFGQPDGAGPSQVRRGSMPSMPTRQRPAYVLDSAKLHQASSGRQPGKSRQSRPARRHELVRRPDEEGKLIVGRRPCLALFYPQQFMCPHARGDEDAR